MEVQCGYRGYPLRAIVNVRTGHEEEGQQEKIVYEVADKMRAYFSKAGWASKSSSRIHTKNNYKFMVRRRRAGRACCADSVLKML